MNVEEAWDMGQSDFFIYILDLQLDIARVQWERCDSHYTG